MSDPRTQTLRLHLDPPVPEDLEAIFAIANDPRTWAHIPGERITAPHQSEATLSVFRTGWQETGLSHWVIRWGSGATTPDLQAGQVLGTGGVHLFETVAGSSVWNLGYRLDPLCWGRGIATELAVRAAAAAADTLPEVPVIARVLSTNPASAKVATKAGLELVFCGEPSAKTRAAVGSETVRRLIFADRDLSPEVLDWLASRG